MESIPLFTGFIINVLCDLAVHGTCTLMCLRQTVQHQPWGEAILPAALQSAVAEFMLQPSAFEV
ncbi:hypothetical protein [Methanosarcina sp.]|uniref:hypothetical protein n=1 Tax=Methanosarcina sp. TaxID=2213 RepID=UPI003C7706BB